MRPPEDVGEPTPKREPLRPISYQVVAGDTLQALARRFGVGVESILWANDLPAGADLLQVGQRLVIPPVSGVLHTVREGDTLLGVALVHEAEPQSIIEANALSDPYVLSIGQQLVVPGGKPPLRPAPPPIEHTVGEGDSLLSIALMHAVEPGVVIRANGLLNPDLLPVGLRLLVPGGQPATAPAPPKPAPVQAASAPKPAAPAPPAPAPTPPSTVSGNAGQEIASLALEFVGYRYRWGGHLPSTGFDCSGFTWYVYQQAGIGIPQHDLWGQIAAGRKVSRDELLPGDLVFFQNTYQPGLSHSGIYVGGGNFVNAVAEGIGVQVRSLSEPYWASRWFAASRPW